MLVNQLAVFLENSQGRISDLCKTLANAGVNVLSMNIADTSDFGIVRIITGDNALAEIVLKNAGFTVARSDLLGIEVADRAGALAEVLGVLGDKNIDVEYLYSYITKQNTALIIIKVKDIQFALTALTESGIKLL